MPDDAFYLADGGGYVATPHTRGPWHPDAQHAGPPSALIGHALERAYPRDAAQIARFTVEILRPVPIAPVEVATEVVRAGRNVELLGGTLSAGGEVLMLARAWRIRTADTAVPEPAGRVLPPPADGVEARFFPGLGDVGWHTAVEPRFVDGGWTEPGPASAWFRLRVPLVAGCAPSPLTRVLVVADAGNGISAAVDFRSFVFVNTDLTVSLHRLPAGEWVHLAAETRAEPHGVGLASSVISDERGPIGRGAQSLFIAARDV